MPKRCFNSAAFSRSTGSLGYVLIRHIHVRQSSRVRCSTRQCANARCVLNAHKHTPRRTQSIKARSARTQTFSHAHPYKTLLMYYSIFKRFNYSVSLKTNFIVFMPYFFFLYHRVNVNCVGNCANIIGFLLCHIYVRFYAIRALTVANGAITENRFPFILQRIHLYQFILFFSAVKFGRMSKKQREKVEDEVRRYQAQIRVQTDATPDSVYDAQQQPSSSDQFHGHYNG